MAAKSYWEKERVLIITLLMLPSIDPYRSTKELAYKFDAMQPQQENLVFSIRLWTPPKSYCQNRKYDDCGCDGFICY